MRFRNLVRGLLIVGTTGLGACLFSTNPPKPSPSRSSGTSDPNAAVVTGLVQLYDRTDHHSRSMPGWAVRADWFVRTGTGLRVVFQDVVFADKSGVYEVHCSDANLAAVELRARVCTFNDQDADCCIDDPPCNHPICTQSWIPERRLELGPGTRERLTLTVPCDHVP